MPRASPAAKFVEFEYVGSCVKLWFKMFRDE
jgi:hypothetical protein